MDIFNGACIAGSVGEAGVAGDGAFVVTAGGAPLTGAAGVGLDVGEGGAAEEFVFEVGVGCEGRDSGGG